MCVYIFLVPPLILRLPVLVCTVKGGDEGNRSCGTSRRGLALLRGMKEK